MRFSSASARKIGNRERRGEKNMTRKGQIRAEVSRKMALFAALLLAGLTVTVTGVTQARGAGRTATLRAGVWAGSRPRPGSSGSLADPANYHIIHTYKIGGTTGWDYMVMDTEHRHLFVSHGDHVVVMNADTGKVVGEIPNTQGVHGIAIADDLGRGFTSDGGANQVTIFSLTTLKTIGTVKVTGHGPDCIIYDPATHRVFTFNGGSDNSTAIDGKTGKVVGTIALGGRPEYAVADGEGHVYNNLVDKSEQVEIDSRTLKIVKRWPLAPGKNPSGLAMDTQHRRLITGCHNNLMVIVNPDAGKVVATVPIGPGVDACRFDPGTQLAFCSTGGGQGMLTVVHEDSPNHFTLVAHVKTQPGARTMALDLKTHNVFTDTATFGPMPAGARAGRGVRGRGGRFMRPPMAPGSFRVIELAP
jgi:hypothetical protein